LDAFLVRGLITEVIGRLKSGKEADVFLCRAHPDHGGALLAAKVYRPRGERAFRAEETYLEGRASLHRGRARFGSVSRAVARRSAAGKELLSELWVRREYEVLRRLAAIGVPAPRPVACDGGAVLMEYLGDLEAPAPRLATVRLAQDEAVHLRRELLAGVEAMLSHGLIHGDLSPYNVLYWAGRAYLIDLPQAVDAAVHGDGLGLLRRDAQNLTRHFARYGLVDDGAAWAEALWLRYVTGRL